MKLHSACRSWLCKEWHFLNKFFVVCTYYFIYYCRYEYAVCKADYSKYITLQIITFIFILLSLIKEKKVCYVCVFIFFIKSSVELTSNYWGITPLLNSYKIQTFISKINSVCRASYSIFATVLLCLFFPELYEVTIFITYVYTTQGHAVA